MSTVKLYNGSRLNDELCEALLTEASTLVGAKGAVIVKVTRGGYSVTSHAKSASRVRRGFLTGKSTHHSWINTTGGYVVMQPIIYNELDPLWTAQNFFETAVHEFAHIVQFQTHRWLNGNYAAFARGNIRTGRRVKWAKRPEEIDAVNRTDEALDKLRRQPARKARIEELILNLAIQLEATAK